MRYRRGTRTRPIANRKASGPKARVFGRESVFTDRNQVMSLLCESVLVRAFASTCETSKRSSLNAKFASRLAHRRFFQVASPSNA